jgi:hypothetical protein
MFAHRLKGESKLLVPKFGNLQKHVEKHKCKCVRPKYNLGQCYMSMKSLHTKWFFYIKGRDVMANIMAIVEDRKMKFLQFVTIFLTFEGWSLVNFEAMKLLFQFLKMKNTMCKHWNNNVRWDIIEGMDQIVLITTKVFIHAMMYLVVNCDESDGDQ